MSAAAVIVLRVKRIFAFLRDRGAVSPETAIPIDEVPYRDRWYFRRLIMRGAVRVLGVKCYLDEPAAALYMRRYRLRALAFLALVLIMALVCIALASIKK